jgi:hypothetical protein
VHPEVPGRGTSHGLWFSGLLVALGALSVLGMQLAPGWGGERTLPKMEPANAAALIAGMAGTSAIGGMLFGLGMARLRAGQTLATSRTEIQRLQREVELFERTAPDAARDAQNTTRARELVLWSMSNRQAPADTATARLAAVNNLIEQLQGPTVGLKKMAQHTLEDLVADSIAELASLEQRFFQEQAVDQTAYLQADLAGRLAILQTARPTNLQGQLYLLCDEMVKAERLIGSVAIPALQAELPAPAGLHRGISHMTLWGGLLMTLGALVMLGIQLAPGWGGKQLLPDMTPEEEATLIMDLAGAGLLGSALFMLGVSRLQADKPISVAGNQLHRLRREVQFWSATGNQTLERILRGTIALEGSLSALTGGRYQMPVPLDQLPTGTEHVTRRLRQLNGVFGMPNLLPEARAVAEQAQYNLLTYVVPEELRQLEVAAIQQNPSLDGLEEPFSKLPIETRLELLGDQSRYTELRHLLNAIADAQVQQEQAS